MKTLKFNHELAQLIHDGKKTSTWRLYDDKDLSVDDQIKFIDKVKPDDRESWRVIGQGKVNEVIEKRLGEISQGEMDGHEPFDSKESMLKTYKSYYGDRVTFDTVV